VAALKGGAVNAGARATKVNRSAFPAIDLTTPFECVGQVESAAETLRSGAALQDLGSELESQGELWAPRPNRVCFSDAVAFLEERRGARAQRAASQRRQEQSGAAAASENPPLDASSRTGRATSVACFTSTFALRRLISRTTKSAGSHQSVVAPKRHRGVHRRCSGP
jgi:hypothetical protein